MEAFTRGIPTFHLRKVMKSKKSAKNIKVVPVSQIISHSISSLHENAEPQEPEPPLPSRPQISDPLDDTFEMDDYSSVVDKSRALQKFAPKTNSSSSVFNNGVDDAAKAKARNEELMRGGRRKRKYVGGVKRSTYKLHSVSQQTNCLMPPPLEITRVGEVKRTYGNRAKKNPLPLVNERVEVKIECDPSTLLDSIDAESDVNVEQEKDDVVEFEFIDVKQEPEVIDNDPYICD